MTLWTRKRQKIRKKEEGLQVTAKGCKQLAGGRRVHLIVAIAYSKGVILKVPYEKMNGNFFAAFVREHLNITFAKAGPKTNGRRLFIMDNDPSQRSRAAQMMMLVVILYRQHQLHEISECLLTHI